MELPRPLFDWFTEHGAGIKKAPGGASSKNAKRVRLDSKSVAALEGGVAVARIIIRCTLVITGSKENTAKVAKSLKGMKADGCKCLGAALVCKIVENETHLPLISRSRSRSHSVSSFKTL